jgi:hypothetical protein
MRKRLIDVIEKIGLLIGPHVDGDAPWTCGRFDQSLKVRCGIIGRVMQKLSNSPA